MTPGTMCLGFFYTPHAQCLLTRSVDLSVVGGIVTIYGETSKEW